ncbi:MAG: sugar ABC transporter permease [Alphaproteobacteria bacterium]|nr:MAG: sugar ABC transporter permease [Alphaproteobacteria bacterium]
MTGPDRMVRRPQRGRSLAPWAFLAPGLALFALFRLYPLVEGLVLSFTNARLGRAAYRFTGLDNYARLLDDTRFLTSLFNTAYYTVASTLPILALPLLLAVALNRPMRLRAVLRGAFFFPFTLSVVTVGLTWLWLLDPIVGPLNYYLRRLGIPVRSWLADPGAAMWAIIATSVWWVTGYYLVIYLAGLQDIPAQLYEAAAIDGANWWQRMRYVTLPMMRNIMAITALFSLIVTFANFDIVRILTAGGPIDRTHVFATWAFWIGIQGNDIPLGASVSLFMVPILTVAAVFILRDIHRRASEMS